MAIKTIPLSLLETDQNTTLNECAKSGETLVDHKVFYYRIELSQWTVAL